MRHSNSPWEAVKNSSWSDDYKKNFGDKSGYVICYTNKNRELAALASVVGQPFVQQEEIDANAKLMVAAPDLLFALQELVGLVEGVIEGDYKPDHFTLQAARIAIKKATE